MSRLTPGSDTAVTVDKFSRIANVIDHVEQVVSELEELDHRLDPSRLSEVCAAPDRPAATDPYPRLVLETTPDRLEVLATRIQRVTVNIRESMLG